MSLRDLWQLGVDAVRGAAAVKASLEAAPIPTPDQIIAVGKAACDMACAAQEIFPGAPTLIVTKHGHGTALRATLIEAGHPVPDTASLTGGAALAETVAGAGPNLLMLVSGGASAVAELLPEGMTLDKWQAETQKLLASGADIHEMNAYRRQISRIKGGKLLNLFKGERVTTLAISDVEGDALNVIGSGIGAAPRTPNFTFDARIVASNAIARQAIAAANPHPIHCNEETLYGDVHDVAERLGATLRSAPKGLMIWGGEPTVRLPQNPGRGGRNQALALLLAREIQGRRIEILVAGTDGTDGPTPDAGAIVTGATWDDTAEIALKNADAGTWLAEKNALLTTGPTGTNVMDLALARIS